MATKKTLTKRILNNKTKFEAAINEVFNPTLEKKIASMTTRELQTAINLANKGAENNTVAEAREEVSIEDFLLKQITDFVEKLESEDTIVSDKILKRTLEMAYQCQLGVTIMTKRSEDKDFTAKIGLTVMEILESKYDSDKEYIEYGIKLAQEANIPVINTMSQTAEEHSTANPEMSKEVKDEANIGEQELAEYKPIDKKNRKKKKLGMKILKDWKVYKKAIKSKIKDLIIESQKDNIDLNIKYIKKDLSMFNFNDLKEIIKNSKLK